MLVLTTLSDLINGYEFGVIVFITVDITYVMGSLVTIPFPIRWILPYMLTHLIVTAIWGFTTLHSGDDLYEFINHWVVFGLAILLGSFKQYSREKLTKR